MQHCIERNQQMFNPLARPPVRHPTPRQRHKRGVGVPASSKRSVTWFEFAPMPSTLAADESSGGLSAKLTFERVIVWPDGYREIEGVTPKQIAPPASHMLPNSDQPASDASDINDLDG
jgi:hypothetical protein